MVPMRDGKTIPQIQNEVHQNAVEHGWWENEPTFPETIALIHSELSESLEAYRDGYLPTEIYYEDGKPEGIPIELADAVIRILDFCGYSGIDLGEAIRIKAEYNMTRPYRHGGKVC